MLSLAIELFAIAGTLILGIIGASVVRGGWKQVIWPLGLATVAATAYAAYTDQQNRNFINSKLTGDQSLCFVEALRSPMPSDAAPFDLWIRNAGIPPLANVTVAIHDGEGRGYSWARPLPEPCGKQPKALVGIGPGVFHLEIDDVPNNTTYEDLTIEKRGDSFHQKISVSGPWTWSWEGDF